MNEIVVLQPQAQSLDELAARINEEHQATIGALRQVVARAFVAGELLREAKARLKHGQWLPWLGANCEIPARTASLYMRLSRHRAELKSAGNLADLTIDSALKLLAPPKEKQDPEPEPEPPAVNVAPEPASAVSNQEPAVAELPAAPDEPKKVSGLGAKKLSELATEEAAKIVKEVRAEIADLRSHITYTRALRESYERGLEDAQAKIAAFAKAERTAEERIEELQGVIELLGAGQEEGAGQGNAADPEADGAGLDPELVTRG